MRVGFAGVVHSHAFSDATSATEFGHSIAVWEPQDEARLAAFADEFRPTVTDSLEALLRWSPDLVVVTLRPQWIASTVRHVLQAGVGCFLNKVAAASLNALDELSAVVSNSPAPFFTSSVLRFSPVLTDFRRQLDGERVLALALSVRHDISAFLRPERRWQDDPADGGGTAISLGLHAWELAAVLGGSDLAATGGNVYAGGSDTRSEDRAVLTALIAGTTPIAATVLGVGQVERYEAVAFTPHGTLSVALGDGDPRTTLGYRVCFAAAIGMVRTGKPPVPWEESRRILETTIRAAAYARSAIDTKPAAV